MTSGQSGGGPSAAGQAAAGTAVDRASEVSSLAGDRANQVAASAADQARAVKSEALAQTRNLVEEAKTQAWHQGEAQTEQLASALSQLTGQARALLEGRPDDAPALVEQGGGVVDRLEQVTDRLEHGGLEGAVRDLQRFARRRPGAFLAGAGALGFAVGRLVRASRDSDGGLGSGSAGGGTGRYREPTYGSSSGTLISGDPVAPLGATGRSGGIPAVPPPPPPEPDYLEQGR